MRSNAQWRLGSPLAGFLGLAFFLFSSAGFAGQEVKHENTRRSPARITPAIMPLWSEGPVGKELGFGIVDRAGAMLLSTGEYNHLHIKQVLSAARGHGWSLKQMAQLDTAKRAAGALGAQVVVVGKMLPAKNGGFSMNYRVYDLRRSKLVQKRIVLPKAIASAVQKGAMALASSVASLDSVKVPKDKRVQPDCNSSKAMSDYLSCAAVLIEQPLGLRKSHVVDPARLKGAGKKCELATRLDPHFGAAWALLSLTRAMSLDGQQASKALQQASGTTGYMPFFTLAKYWLATRFDSSQKGQDVLSEAVRAQPGALIFRTYLGEHLNITRKYKKALGVWDRYLAVVPRSPYAMAQKAYSLARLGKLDEAISLTRKAVALDEDSLDLKLELASRLVDAKKLKEAETILLPLVDHPKVFGELLLRLGYVYMLEKKDTEAEKYFKRALNIAKGPNEWRTRGRSNYDLAIVYARKGDLAAAEKRLLAAAKEGFMMKDLLKTNPDLQVLSKRKSVRHLFHDPDLKLSKSIFSTSPFPLDASGALDPNAKRTAITGFTF